MPIHTATMPMHWEYLTVELANQGEPLHTILNPLGAEGWELVAVTETVLTSEYSGDSWSITAYLKRPLCPP
jgi:hypothetical protein